MKKNRSCTMILIVLLLALVIAPWANATVCDDQPGAVDYLPTVDSSLLNAVLNLLGEIPIDLDFDQNINLLYDHTMTLSIDSAINLAGINFEVTPGTGSIGVLLHLPAWAVDMTINITHGDFRNCSAEYNACRDDCDDDYDACCTYPLCDLVCGPIWVGCEALCAGALGLCHTDNGARTLENEGIDLLLDDSTAGLSFDSTDVSQVADVCVTETCEAVHPLVSTDADIQGLHLALLPEGDSLGIGEWLNNIISSIANWLLELLNIIEPFFVAGEGGGVLIGAFSADIKNDGCVPDPAVMECIGNSCSIASHPVVNVRDGISLVLYSLPILVIGGLIFWRRRR